MSRRQLVNNPASFTPSPYGLLDVVQWVTPTGPHWQSGIVYQTNCLNSGETTFDPCTAVSGAGEPPEKEPTTERDLRGATPFTARVRFDCSTVNGMDEAREIIDKALAQSEGWQVERAFWTGAAGGEANIVFPHLAADAEFLDPEDTDVLLQSLPITGTAADPVCGLGFLEEELADCYNGRGVIHVPRRVLPTLVHSSLVEERNGQLVTMNGNLVAVGSGYPGTGPSAQSVTQCQSWLYATGAVFGYRQTAPKIQDVRESLDRSKNTVEMHAERTYLLSWDCCHAAVQVDLGVPG